MPAEGAFMGKNASGKDATDSNVILRWICEGDFVDGSRRVAHRSYGWVSSTGRLVGRSYCQLNWLQLNSLLLSTVYSGEWFVFHTIGH